MQGSISKLLAPLRSLRVEAPVSRPHTPTIEENNEQDTSLPTLTEAAERTVPKIPSARQRLDGLASFRIRPKKLIFTSGTSPQRSGGKADVIQATFRQGIWKDEQVVAVKKIRYHPDMNQKKFSNEFVHEVEIMAGLSHKNIVKLVGFVEDLENGKAWIVLSWEPNGNVSEFLATGRWEIPERVSLIKDAFEGVKYLHTSHPPICHGDLKSLNILVSSSYRAIITDFGSARAIIKPEVDVTDEELEGHAQQSPTTEQAHPQIDVNAIGNQLTLTGPAWSLRWAPPEVVSGKRPGLSTDIWAAGWIAWEVMTDKVPFYEVNSAGAITLMVIRGEVPATHEDAQLAQIIALCSLMKDCWAFNPKARPNIARCCTELRWIPSIPPSGGQASDDRVRSIGLLLKLGWMHYDQNDFEKAISLFQEALCLAKSSGNQTAAANALMNLGHVYRIQSKCTQAEESLAGAQAIYAHVGNDVGRANTLGELGEVYRSQSKYTQAEESFTRAQEIYVRVDSDQGRANVLHGLGILYGDQSKYTQAEESLARAQETYARTGDNLGQANTLGVLGNLYHRQSKYTQAEESYTQAREIFARIGGDLGRASVLARLGDLYRGQSKYTQAEESYTQAREISARIGDDRGQANTLAGLGDVYCHQSKYTLAEESYTRAQEIYTRIGDDLGRANVQRGLGELRQNQGRNVEAALHYVEARYSYARIGNIDCEEKAAQLLAALLPEQNSATP